ncbi:hypothetical protein BSPA14S_H0042 (plasmid) [Borreliella spielmanii A14S]|uniref:Uncharacterized protein n=1 Tax=Borreliella spielmanii A14S TaxID=498742 RepID=C0RCG8_9SPIR|nr:hypothetical protein BSPA14S_H0042 [Borreliella spielmanii A14S]
MIIKTNQYCVKNINKEELTMEDYKLMVMKIYSNNQYLI